MHIDRNNNYYSTINIYGRNWGLFDIIGCTVAAILFMLYISQFTKDRRALALKDPAKPWHP